MSSRLILIETSTALCSTALAEGGKIISERRSTEPRAHASQTAPFVKEMLDEAGWKASDCDAVCVGMGPGSYTGLRVGVSTAKGLCFGAGLPLLAIDTLETLFWQGFDRIPEGCTAVLPMIDARRMEVYTCTFSPTGDRLTPISPLILDTPATSAELPPPGLAEAVPTSESYLIIGDAANKAEQFLNGTSKTGPADGPEGPRPKYSGPEGSLPAGNYTFIQEYPEAKAMLRPAMRELEHKSFRDVAYFEPFYLKEFIATVSRKKLF